MTLGSVWAPNPAVVELVVGEDRHRMTRTDDGWWHAGVDVPAGMPYAYSLDGRAPIPDPRARSLPHGIHGPGVHVDPASFLWTDGDWAGRGLEGSVLYELHVGTFTPEGTLDAAAARLPHLVDLGVTTVELMPVNAFPGRHGWGYDGVGLFAVHEPYGGPAALARFVDVAHRLGLAVYLDVVHNHLGPDGAYLTEFGPYLTDRHRTPWGPAVNLDGPGSPAVRVFLLDNVRWWFEAFHLDGLRLDAVHALRDDSSSPILEEMAQVAVEVAAGRGFPAVLVAEDDRNDPRTTMPRSEGGSGLDGQWVDDVHHALHVAVTGETGGYYADFAAPDALTKVLRGGFFHDGSFSTFRGRPHGSPLPDDTPRWRLVASLQTHDQVGNRRLGDRISHLAPAGAVAAAAALLLTSPFTPMLFMGEEWAASTPWQYFADHVNEDLAAAVRSGRAAEFASHGWGPDDVPDPIHPGTLATSRLDWTEPARPVHAAMLAWYRSLLALRRAEPDLRGPDIDVRWDAEKRVGVVHRGSYRVVVNLADVPTTVPLDGPADLVLAWDATLDTDVVLTGPGAAIVRVR